MKKRTLLSDMMSPPEEMDEAAVAAKAKQGEGKTAVDGLINQRIVRNPFAKQQRNYRLPVSKSEVNMTLLELDPKSTFPSALNPRDQELLLADDPKVAEIRESMLVHGQSEPVYARPVTVDGEMQYEVYVGTTRRFCAMDICQVTDPEFKLLAWVSDKVGDVDAAFMAREENDKRRDLSVYEKAIDLKRQSERPELVKLTQDKLSASLNVSQGYLSKMLKLCELPKVYLECLEGVGSLTLRQGLEVIDIDKAFTAKQRDDAQERIKADLGAKRFKGGDKLVNALRAIQKEMTASKKGKKANGETVIKNASGKVIAKLVPHRTEEGRCKIELFDVTQDLVGQLLEHIENAGRE